MNAIVPLRLVLEPEELPFVLREAAILGRLADCHVQIIGDGVSRRHATVFPNGRIWAIADLQSKNGVFVNEHPVHRCELNDGDRIRVGNRTLRCEFGDFPGASIVLDEDHEQTMLASVDLTEVEERLRSGPRPPGGSPPSVPPASRQRIAASDGDPSRIVALLHAATEQLLASATLDEMLESVLRLACDHLRAERGFIGLYDDATDRLTRRSVRTMYEGSSEEIRISSQIARTAIRDRHGVLVEDARVDERFDPRKSIEDLEIHSAMCAPLCYDGRVVGLVYVDTRKTERAFGSVDLEVLSTLAAVSAAAVAKARLADEIAAEKRIRTQLERYHAPAVVTRIIEAAAGGIAPMIAEEREVSVLFLDLCGFTTLSEALTPSAVTKVLNEVFAGLTDAVFRFDGTLDKFTGDGLMVFFGAPLLLSDHAPRAVRAALAMQEFLENFEGPTERPKLAARIGINSGPVVVGDIGSPQRRDYTVIGDTVNVASRLESSVALPGWIVVGPATRSMLEEGFECEALPPVRLKGKTAPTAPWRVRGARSS